MNVNETINIGVAYGAAATLDGMQAIDLDLVELRIDLRDAWSNLCMDIIAVAMQQGLIASVADVGVEMGYPQKDGSLLVAATLAGAFVGIVVPPGYWRPVARA